MELRFPSPSLIVLAGPSGCGKSTWARANFKPTAIISSDAMRGWLTDDESSLDVNEEAFALVHLLAEQRLRLGRPTVIDSTALLARDRRSLLAIAEEVGVSAHLVVFDVDEHDCLAAQRNRERTVPDRIVTRHVARLRSMLGGGVDALAKEGFASVHVLDRAQMSESAVSWTEGSTIRDIDVISDVHGCSTELQQLIADLGYHQVGGTWQHPDDRILAFVGDLGDRGPDSLGVFLLVDRLIADGRAVLAALGNHDWKLYRYWVLDRKVTLGHGLAGTIRQLNDAEGVDVMALLKRLFDHAPLSTVFDDGRLVITHGAVVPEGAGHVDRSRRGAHAALAMFGQRDGDDPVTGRPMRVYHWIDEWTDPERHVIHGHDVIGREVLRRGRHGNVWSIDTGCAFGGRLTAVRWPSQEVVQVDAARTYYAADDLPL